MRKFNPYGYAVLDDSVNIGRLFTRSLLFNPVITAAAGVNIIAGGCTTMTNAVILSIMLLVLLPILGLVSALERDRLSDRARPAVFALVSCAVVYLIAFICNRVSHGSADALGIFLPLAALDTLVFTRYSDTISDITIPEAMAIGGAYACAFALMALPVAFIREVIGNGTIFGEYIHNGITGLRKPYFGFILCGILLALGRRLVRARAGTPRREEGDDE